MSADLAVHERSINRLLVRYATAIDTKDWCLLGSCFTPQCRFTATGLVLEGVDSIVSFMENAHRYIDGSHHRLSNVVIDVTDDFRAARSTTYLDATLVRRDADAGATFRVMSTYHDEHEFDGSTWWISSRDVRSMWNEGNPAVLGLRQ